jgi:hypothetical protein
MTWLGIYVLVLWIALPFSIWLNMESRKKVDRDYKAWLTEVAFEADQEEPECWTCVGGHHCEWHSKPPAKQAEVAPRSIIADDEIPF